MGTNIPKEKGKDENTELMHKIRVEADRNTWGHLWYHSQRDTGLKEWCELPLKLNGNYHDIMLPSKGSVLRFIGAMYSY